MDVAGAVNIEDLRLGAKRYLPRILFDWIDGGAGDEAALAESVAEFAQARLIPRYLVDISKRSLAKSLFGRTYDLPFGVAPMGNAGLFRRGADVAMAQAAKQASAPFILSGATIATIEEAAAAAPGHVWLQVYPARDIAITQDMIARAAAAGIETLVITVDLPLPAKRERDIRNGFGLPLRIDWRILFDGALHPLWTLEWFRNGGMPKMGAWAAYAPKDAGGDDVAQFMMSQFFPVHTWRDLERYRGLWKGKLVVKGLQHPDDAKRAVEVGCDGIIVSNHGGRQFDRAPTPLSSLPSIKTAVQGMAQVMIDGGVRRGADIAIALASGADFVVCGRAILYGVAAGGLAGANRSFAILRDELDRTLGQIGCARADELDGGALFDRREKLIV
jgi:isopentenyl diphosphate isomerase/L-lactate dehydrogenase-like FMN-dependent dehydrogenase